MRSGFACIAVFFLSACSAPLLETPPTEPEITPADTSAVEARQTPPEPIAPLPVPEAAVLNGLTPRQVQSLIGEPTLVRRDANVQIMLFENRECVFEVIFYEPNRDAHFIARDINARTRQGHSADQDTCLGNILPEGQWLADPTVIQ